MHPLAPSLKQSSEGSMTSSQAIELKKLEDWVNNPHATMDGVLMNPQLKNNILDYAKELIKVAKAK